eukprot:TRINITY_DN146_c0_g1_i1.p1 TRINITY_DN146_c0_g1~~TRINITY_DN146_c0_g1_i1.p1  ORF type:complete len:387 (-),score=82.75 TRINITY_DN146_c0_g1_i1:197-1357(-)
MGRIFVASFSSLMIGGVNGEVSTYSMDGKTIKGIKHKLSGEKLNEPVGLTVDIFKQKVYWVDKTNNHVFWSDYDGSKGAKMLTAFNAFMVSMVNFENSLMWIDPRELKVKSYNLRSHESVYPFTVKVPQTSHALAVIQEQMQPKLAKNPCEDSGCSQLCLLSAVGSYTCMCSYGYKPVEDNSTACEKISNIRPFAVSDSDAAELSDDLSETDDGPQKTPIAGDDNTGLIVGLVIFFLVLLLVAIFIFVWIRHKKTKKSTDAIAFTNSSFNNNESATTTDKESQVTVRRGAILSCDNPMFVDSPQNTPETFRYSFLKFGNSSEVALNGNSPNMDFTSVLAFNKGSSKKKPKKEDQSEIVDEASISYDDVSEQHLSVAFHKDKQRLID